MSIRANLSLAMAAAVLCPLASHANSFTVIAETGGVAPGFAAGENVEFIELDTPFINDRGQVAFAARLEDTDGGQLPSPVWSVIASDERGVFSRRVTSGDTVSGRTAGETRRVEAINDQGYVVAAVSSTSTADRGLWTDTGGVSRLIGVQGTDVTSLSGDIDYDIATFEAIGGTGEVYFDTSLMGPDASTDSELVNSDQALLRLSLDGGVTTIARTLVAPDANFPDTYPRNMVDSTRVNDAGDAVFRIGPIAKPGSGDVGIYSEAGGWYLRERDTVDLGPTYRSGSINPSARQITGRHTLDGAGNAIVPVDLSGGALSSRTQALISLNPETGVNALLVQEGQAPGLPAGIFFDNFGFNELAANAAGDVVFRARLADTTDNRIDNNNDDSLWLYRDGLLTMLAREGAPAPTLTDVTVRSMTEFSINDLGQVIMRLQLDGTDVDSANDSGLFGFDGTDFSKIAREGDDIRLDGTLTKLTSLVSVPLSGSEDGRGKFLNNNGDFVFLATLESGQAIVAGNMTGSFQGTGPVPLPAAVWMMLGGVGLLARPGLIRRRQR